MTLSPEEFERIQYTRASALGYDLIETGDDTYPFRVERHGEVMGAELRSILDVAEWLNDREEEERN